MTCHEQVSVRGKMRWSPQGVLARGGAVLVAVALAVPGAWAAEIACEQQELSASDGEPGDAFGTAVSIHGDLAIVGAPNDDDQGVNSGAAYIYRLLSSTWIEEAKLLAPDGADFDFFGRAVVIHGDVAIVGADRDDDRGFDAGAAYVFRWDGTAWNLESKLLASDGGPLHAFGIAVDVGMNVALVGARGHVEDGVDQVGAAYVFRFDGTDWTEENVLEAGDGWDGDQFGASVSLHGDAAVIGAPGHEHNTGMHTGAAYVFRSGDGGWTQEAELLASDGLHNDRYGADVALRGDVLLVGAPKAADNGSDAGAVYVYRFDGSLWHEQVKLLASDGASFDEFGRSVSLGEDLALVGAHGSDQSAPNGGAVYPFIYDSGSWQQQATIVPSAAGQGDFFGEDVVTDGELILAGAGSGAHVFDVAPCACPADLDDDGSVGVTDFLELLAAWGTDPGGPPDFDGNGAVGVSDFLYLLSAWGTCP